MYEINFLQKAAESKSDSALPTNVGTALRMARAEFPGIGRVSPRPPILREASAHRPLLTELKEMEGHSVL
jgi:hypothetical protein